MCLSADCTKEEAAHGIGRLYNVADVQKVIFDQICQFLFLMVPVSQLIDVVGEVVLPVDATMRPSPAHR